MTEQVVEVRNGEIFWRGIYKPLTEALALRDHFNTYTDWFTPQARVYARQLSDAIQKVTEGAF